MSASECPEEGEHRRMRGRSRSEATSNVCFPITTLIPSSSHSYPRLMSASEWRGEGRDAVWGERCRRRGSGKNNQTAVTNKEAGYRVKPTQVGFGISARYFSAVHTAMQWRGEVPKVNLPRTYIYQSTRSPATRLTTSYCRYSASHPAASLHPAWSAGMSYGQ